MDKKTEARLEELAAQKREIHRYQEEHEREFGPSDSCLLDVLEDYIHEHGHVEIDIESVSGVISSDDNDEGMSLREMLADMRSKK